MQRLLGQPHAIEVLRNALRSGRFHHAWIFSGPRGVGKHTTAVELARILLDPAAGPTLTGEIEADPESETSRLIDAGTHPDLHTIRKELALYSENPELRRKKLMNIPLDVLREFMIGGRTNDERTHEGPVYHTASRGHGKVFIIDEAELIDRYGQNALLKTLEEPPARTYILLITTRPERLFPTVRSRCQHVRFGRLDETAMREWFARADLDLADDERAWIERFAEGSPGVAQLAAEYGFHRWQTALDPLIAQLEAGEFPVSMGATLAELVEEFAVEWVKRHRNASKDAANKDGVRHVLALLSAHARATLHDSCEDADDAETAVAIIERIRTAEYQLERNVNQKQLLENLVVQWARAVRRPVAT